MGDKDYDIITIDLKIDIEKEILNASRNISEDTRKAIDNLVKTSENKKREDKEQKEQKEQQKEQWSDDIKLCYKMLEAGTQHNPVIGENFLKHANTDNLSGLMIRIRNYHKKLKTDKTIAKKRFLGKTAYYLK